MDPASFYHQRLTELNRKLATFQNKKSLLGWARFLTVALSAIWLYLLIPLGWIYAISACSLLLAAFIKFLFKDLDNNKKIIHTNQLIQINVDEIKALNDDYQHFEEGADYQPKEHNYSSDMDIFGKASLYQYLNRSTSSMGGHTLADWLLNPGNPVLIHERQTAIKELAAKTQWRQSLQAFGKEKKIEHSTFLRLQEWVNEENRFINNHIWIILQSLIPVIMISVVVLNIFDILSNPIRNIFLICSALVAFFISKKVVPLHAQVSRIADEMDVLSDSIYLIENETFKAPFLATLQTAFKTNHLTASGELKKLKGIVQRLDWRLNPVVFVPLAILLQWDLIQVIALEKWKNRNRVLTMRWLEALGSFEAISSLSTLHFNHPDWCFPELHKEHFFIEGSNMGHPLIKKSKRVNNLIDIRQKGIIMLVTGSNMAGKSTYLRSIGVNTVLTMAGSVVCASRFSLSPVLLVSSMRIADNLEENTSTFYAELKKLKTVITMVNQQQKVFILLDEILRGTNSLDRHTGAVAFTKQLIRQQAAAIIATHDVELAQLKEEYPEKIQNYHFDVQVSGDELFFDYTLREGICSSLNASLLMKKIGIEL